MSKGPTLATLLDSLLSESDKTNLSSGAHLQSVPKAFRDQIAAWNNEVCSMTVVCRNTLVVSLKATEPIDGNVLSLTERYLTSALAIAACEIHVNFSEKAIQSENFLCRLFPWAADAMDNQDFEVFRALSENLICRSEKTKLIIEIPQNQKRILSKGSIYSIKEFFQERCELKCSVEVKNSKTEAPIDSYFESRENAFSDLKPTPEEPLTDAINQPIRTINEQGEPAVNGYKKKKLTAKKNYRSKKPDNLLWGRMDDRLELTDLKLLDAESGFVSVYGSVARYESRLISNNTRALVKFALHGINGAISCILFLRSPEEEAELREKIPNGTFVRADLNVSFDNRFTKDLQGQVVGLCSAEAPKARQDLALEKRVELHLHTNMSAKDGFIRPKELVKLADRFGMPAVAITDHGVVQSYPEACEMLDKLKAKGSTMKLIYGCEIYLMEDGEEAAYGFRDLPIQDSYVALDLETTGLDASQDRIIEIGAVRFRRDESGHFYPEERYTSFVNPGIPIPAKITELTGISNEMIAGAPAPLGALQDLHEFIGEDPICGHNILFDLGFLRYESYRTPGKDDAKLKFNPVCVDTLPLSRHFLPEMKRYKLGEVAKQLNIPLQNAHRAVDDALASGFIFEKLWANTDYLPLRELNQRMGQHTLAHVKEFKNKPYHAVVLVKDLLGLYNLYRLVSESHIRYFKGKPRIPRSLLKYLRNGLILGSACEAGEVFRGISKIHTAVKGDLALAKAEISNNYALQRTAKFYDYLEIQPLGNNTFMIEKENNAVHSEEDLRNLNRLIIELGNLAKKPIVATCDAHVLNKVDTIYRQILQVTSGFEAQENPTELYFRSTDEMLEEFSWLPAETAEEIVVRNPRKIAEMIQTDLRPFPKGTFPPVIQSAADDVLKITWESVEAKYGKNGVIPENIRERVEKELRSIIENGFAIMYYISHKLVKHTNEDGYIVGSRGSVGSSVVAFFCGISEVNPLPPHYVCPNCKTSLFAKEGAYGSGFDLPEKACPDCGTDMVRDGQDIPFETFLGFHGDKQPDIDLNFSGEYQSTAHQYIEQMFGTNHTYRAGTITGFAEKNAAGLVLKYMEQSNLFLTRAEIDRLADGLNGVKKSTGQHPGGIVVIPKDREIYDFTPIQFPADKENAPMNTTHFDFNSMHDTILKLDILGHDDPTMLKVMSDYTGVKIEDIPIPDKKVMDLFSGTEALGLPNGSTPADCGSLGLPEMGTRMARDMIRETKPTRFFDLVQLMGLSHGTDVWNGNAQDLIRSGTATINDVIGCRDGIMTNLMNWGLPPKNAFDIMEKVRKGKGLTEEQEALMVENQVPEWYIESCRKIKYMFPKAHAAAYVISSLRVAWFKVYRPAAYYAAYFSVRADEFDYSLMCQPHEKITALRESMHQNFHELTDREVKIYYIMELVEEMYLRGIYFAPIDLMEAGASRFTVLNDYLIMPALNTLPSVSSSMAGALVEARKEGEFKSHEDIQRRSGLGQAAIKAMADAGILEDIPETAQLSLFDILST